MIFYSSDNDFATVLLTAANEVERCQLQRRVIKGAGLPAAGYNNKEAQLGQIHRAMHHRAHQAEY